MTKDIYTKDEIRQMICTKIDNKEKFLQDFVNAWNKVMNADRFDIKR